MLIFINAIPFYQTYKTKAGEFLKLESAKGVLEEIPGICIRLTLENLWIKIIHSVRTQSFSKN